MSRIKRVINSRIDDDTVHLVVGHGQIRDCEKYFYVEKDLNFPMNFICLSNGYPRDFISIIEDEMKNEERPLKITAIIWQNDIPNISLDSVRDITKKAEDLLKVYTRHNLAFPEILFLPGLKTFAQKIAKINEILAEFNEKRGLFKYPLYKAGSVKANWVNPFFLKNKTKYVKFIRKFHLNNFITSAPMNL